MKVCQQARVQFMMSKNLILPKHRQGFHTAPGSLEIDFAKLGSGPVDALCFFYTNEALVLYYCMCVCVL